MLADMIHAQTCTDMHVPTIRLQIPLNTCIYILIIQIHAHTVIQGRLKLDPFETDQRKELIPLDDKFFIHFTKVIVLHRENIRDQSISKVIAENILGNHMINYKYDDVKNYIDENLVNDWEKMFEENDLYVSNLKNNCNHFTYEEIYVRKEYGRLCEYLGIGDPKYLHLLDRTNRYRK
jgi:hypothetical protein